MASCNNDFRSTEQQIKDFVQSLIWRDILQEIENWKNRILEDLAQPSYDSNTGKMVLQKAERVLYDEMLRGNLQALNQVERIPEIIMEILKQTKKGANNGNGQ